MPASSVGSFAHCAWYDETDALTVVMFVFGVVCIEVWHTDMPVWAFILALVRDGQPFHDKKLIVYRLSGYLIRIHSPYWDDSSHH